MCSIDFVRSIVSNGREKERRAEESDKDEASVVLISLTKVQADRSGSRSLVGEHRRRDVSHDGGLKRATLWRIMTVIIIIRPQDICKRRIKAKG